MTINTPSTVFVEFTSTAPRLFCLYDDKGRSYYFRYLDGRTPRIKFNVPDPGVYSTSVPINVLRVDPIQTPDNYPELPPAERDRWKDVTIEYNPSLEGTPARIFTETGVIQYGPDFLSYPPAIRLFLFLHEQAHMLYKTEEYCDLWALVAFLRMGYNRSTAYYALDKILSRSQGNIDRIKYLLTQITVNGDQFQPY